MALDVTQVAGPLWIGSHPPVPGHSCQDHNGQCHPGELAASGFRVLVLCAQEWQPTSKLFPGVEVIHAPFDDNHQGLTSNESKIAFGAAEKTAERIKDGMPTLVTCWAGRNRSGLVCALALSAVSELTAGQAGDLIRERRFGALTNMKFRALLNRVNTTLEGATKCELCEAKPVTRRYHEDGVCWIADCKQCHVPMAVYKNHGVVPGPAHLEHMLGLLQLCGKPSRRGHYFDDSMETIPDHYHVHLRPA